MFDLFPVGILHLGEVDRLYFHLILPEKDYSTIFSHNNLGSFTQLLVSRPMLSYRLIRSDDWPLSQATLGASHFESPRKVICQFSGVVSWRSHHTNTVLS